MQPILRAGDNCWRIAEAERLAVLVDGENYFRALREACINARRAIFLVGWDIHSQLRLVREPVDDGYPETLGALLDALAEERPQLDIFVLCWDFSMIYAMEREFFPRYRLRWKSHDRVRFCLDGNHPVGASQHEKIVVIDDAIAFAGGLDITQCRWDTREHRADEPRREAPGGGRYPPFHDLQVLLDGEAAAALAEQVRERWRQAADESPPELLEPAGPDPWPAQVAVQFEQVSVGITRTRSAYAGRDAVGEAQQLYLDSIAAARDFIYIENQYLSSHAVGEALAARLREADGPQVVVVMPEKTEGWLEQHTMDVLRARLVRSLREADQDDRLRLYYVRAGEDPHVSVIVHAKCMIIDDRFVRIGSTNLSNRSMGLDAECDLVIDAAEQPSHGEQIARLRRDLLAEHLGVEVDAVERAEQDCDGLIAAIESLREPSRSHMLMPLDTEVPDNIDAWVPDAAVLDPEQPVEPEAFFDYLVPAVERGNGLRHALQIGGLVLLLLGLAALWRWTPMAEWLQPQRLQALAQDLREAPAGPFLLLGAFVLASTAMVPLTLLIVATVAVFGTFTGMAYALAGGEIAALVGFGLGHAFGRNAVRKLAGSRVNRLSRSLSKRGVLTVMTLRMLPVAPFTLINIVAGISDIRLRDFMIGTLLGLLPGILALTLLTDRILASLRHPDWTSIGLLLAVTVGVVALMLGLRKWLRRSRDED
ncbi:hypothetical protein E4634_09865 [Mangrovimicrobium sediminis]|uniref:PLD phosphodiesterase domain-containing protein n=1 Tax=Mangrovimicrobium sediminis TaxID=2562682 RepID=A0A4Z0M148_9GAMM|nr:VTT domain-containing protein [Haliea sp. SAOS-164]TGD73332.1 hypothetical protein E4634_09865 [Haliea sp. SAOS-164]